MKKLILSCLLFITINFIAIGQGKTISGTVTGSDVSEPLIGLNVVAKGTSIGTVTDVYGRYALEVPEGTKVIVFSYLGYTEKEVELGDGGTLTIDVTLEPQQVDLNTVVVSASRKQERMLDAPASVTVINAEDIENRGAVTVVDHIQNNPGVDVMKTGLVSSNVVLRGFNNVFSTSTLVIVDDRIASIPSTRLNAYRLIPTSDYDIQRMEIVRGPGSALYGPNAADGVMAIYTKSPLDQEKKFETTIGWCGGLRAKSGDGPTDGVSWDDEYSFVNSYGDTVNVPGKSVAERGMFSNEIRHSGKLTDKIGYKISGGYQGGYDWRNYDMREPVVGDTLIFGTVRNGSVFEEDTTIPREPFDRDFKFRKVNTDIRLDFRISKDVDLILSGGIASAAGIELTVLGSGQAENWMYYNGQARLRWKRLYFNYYVNANNAGGTYLNPQANGAPPPHNAQILIEKSKLHVGQVQHSSKLFQDKLNLIYGVDGLFTLPESEGTINGRFEDDDNVMQVGGYTQAEWDIITKLTLVGAMRVDWHNEVEGAFVSPRAALVYKPTSRHSVRATYNRAFTSPSTLNLSMDLSNGLLPNGINIRGIGNRDGYHYIYDDSGNPMFMSPVTQSRYSVGDMSDNYKFFDNLTAFLGSQMAAASGVPPAVIAGVFQDLMDGITTSSGSIQDVSHLPIDFLKLYSTRDFASSVTTLDGVHDIKPIDNQVNQTWEIGYKGILFDKLSLTADFYFSRISDYISPLTLATPSVMFNPQEFLAAIGGNNQGPGNGILYENLQKPSFAPGMTYDQFFTYAAGLDGNPMFQDPTGIIPSVPGTTWDEFAVMLSSAAAQIPVGTVSPNDDKVDSDIMMTYVNLGTVDIGGMDLGAKLAITKNITVGLAYSYVTDDRIPLEGAQGGFVALNAPKHKTASTFEYSNEKSGLSGRMAYRWQAAFPGNSAIYAGDVEAAHYLDIGLSYALPFSKDTKISLDISNVTNNKHRPFPGAPKMGTFAFFKITHTFKSRT